MSPRLLFLLIVLALPPCTVAAAPEIHPRPQHADFSGEYVQATSVSVEKAQVADAEGAYALSVRADGSVTVRFRDELGLYYAKQTLSQMLRGVEGADNARRDPFPQEDVCRVATKGPLPVGEVRDWPSLPCRGVVEGFYGFPWSHADRSDQFEFYGRNKLNTYIYAPKDDPYHRGEGCYKPYPEPKAREIEELVEHARRHHVRFVWGIHPANTVKWEVEEGRHELEGLCGKLERMYALGVRDFAVLVDDNEGEIIKPLRQAQLCNYILGHFIRRHPDVNQRLIMCPSHYSKYWATPEFLRTLGENLDASTHVMWTGDTVVHDINLPGQQWVHRHLGRPTFVWWNWPCSDFKRNRLCMGRAHGLDTAAEMPQELTGFVANPMEHAEASKVGLFCVADYAWNPCAYEGEGTWRMGIARLYPACAEALQTFCNHAAYLHPGDDGFDHEESVELAPVASRLRTALFEGRGDDAASTALREEFERIADAAHVLEKLPAAEPLRADIGPWIHAFSLLAQTGMEAMDALLSHDSVSRLESYCSAMRSLELLQSVERKQLESDRSITTRADVEVGALVLYPTVVETLRAVGDRVYADLCGRETPRTKARFICKGGNPDRESLYISDNNEKTWWPNGRDQSEGDWYGLDFGKTVKLTSVSLVMGAAQETDYALCGQMEYSPDGENWLPLGGTSDGCRVMLDLRESPVLARLLRYRVIKPRGNWLAINEFHVNRPLDATADYALQDGDLCTWYDASSPSSVEVDVPAGATEAFVVGNVPCTLSDAEGEVLQEGIRRFPLPEGDGRIRLQVEAKEGGRLYELIFR